MTVEELANQLQETYNKKIAELTEINDTMSRELLDAQRSAKLYKQARDESFDRIEKYFSYPWYIRIFKEWILYK